MEQLWIRIAMEIIHLHYMPNLHSRVDTWQFANERPFAMERMLEQVHYKRYGTLR